MNRILYTPTNNEDLDQIAEQLFSATDLIFNFKPGKNRTLKKREAACRMLGFNNGGYRELQAIWKTNSTEALTTPSKSTKNLPTSFWVNTDWNDAVVRCSEPKRHPNGGFLMPDDMIEEPAYGYEDIHLLENDPELATVLDLYKVVEARCVMPNTNEYGVPDFACHDGALKRIKELGFTPAESLELEAYDTGDDSGTCFYLRFSLV